jgi:lysophospholipase L1-like esterase
MTTFGMVRFVQLVIMMSGSIVVILLSPLHPRMLNRIFPEETVTLLLTSDGKWMSIVAVAAAAAKKQQQSTGSTKVVVACVGDSITEWACVTEANMTYPSQMQQMLGDNYNVINFGVSARTLMKNGYCDCSRFIDDDDDNNCAYWNTDAYKNAMESNPDIVTIMLGTNDAKECNWYGPPNNGKGYSNETFMGYRSAYIEMVQLFQSLPSKPKVYLVIPPPLVNPPSSPDNPPPYQMQKQVINEFLPVMIPTIADETGATGGIIDTWTALGGIDGFENDTMTCDGCHPKDVAMTIIAQAFVNAILRD